tara:strand:- start:4732 stop:5004 length:273 start_codon:yes stop_codon:yes gene_type:complete
MNDYNFVVDSISVQVCTHQRAYAHSCVATTAPQPRVQCKAVGHPQSIHCPQRLSNAAHQKRGVPLQVCIARSDSGFYSIVQDFNGIVVRV